MQGEPSQRTLLSIQICRGLAAFCVLLFHLGGALAAPKYFNQPLFSEFFCAGGALGVDFFFVLSGFIIATVHWRDIGNSARLPTYLYKRFVRIYPLYWIVFFAVWALALLMPNLSVPNDFVSVFNAAVLLPQDPKVVGGTGAPVIIVAWSLQYEMLFYTFFALLIANKNLGLVAAGLFVGWLVAGWLFEWRVPLGFLVPMRLMLFAAGMLVALVVRSGMWAPAGRPAALAGATGFFVLAVVVSLGGGTYTLNTPIWSALFGAAAALLIFGLAVMERQGWKPRWQAGVHLGDASYALYLAHYPIISVVCKAAVVIGLAGLVGAAITWVAAIVICIGVALALHLGIERPLMKSSREVLSAGFLRRRIA